MTLYFNFIIFEIKIYLLYIYDRLFSSFYLFLLEIKHNNTMHNNSRNSEIKLEISLFCVYFPFYLSFPTLWVGKVLCAWWSLINQLRRVRIDLSILILAWWFWSLLVRCNLDSIETHINYLIYYLHVCLLCTWWF